MTLSPLGDTAVVLSFGTTVDDATLERVRNVAAAIAARKPSGVIDILPAFASVTVFYDPVLIESYEALATDLETLVNGLNQTKAIAAPSRLIEIPICYEGDHAPDLAEVVAHTGLTSDEIVRRHATAEYTVHAIGFVPGFAYLGGLPPALATPRRKTPRPHVPAGALGIGGDQTGIYPLDTPGGWNLIGRTPLRLFDPACAEPSLLRAGDRVKFTPITSAQFVQWPSEPVSASLPPLSQADRPRLKILQPGMLTTVQDLGRPDRRAQGVPVGGAADAFALRLANLLVGNPDTAAALELTLVGPEIEFERDTLVALTGADFPGLPHARAVRFARGERLKLGAARTGCRGYLAVSGGFDVPVVLGSRATYLKAALGGFAGRVLHAGNRLPLGPGRQMPDTHWHLDERIQPAYSPSPVLRVVRAAQTEEFSPTWLDAEFKVSPQSDRMGVRLQGSSLTRNASGDLRSTAVLPGTVQVPPDGQPIVLLADAQTLGGYPQLAHVISVDLPLIAQLRPGDTVRFHEVTLVEAHTLAHAREHALAILREGLVAKFL